MQHRSNHTVSFVVRLIAEVLPGLAALFRKAVPTEAVHAREVMLQQCLEDLEDRHMAEERLAAPAKRWSHEDLQADADLAPIGETSAVHQSRQRHES